MLFSGGLVPSYIMWTRTFHIQNTVFALLIPNLLMSAFNVIMMRTYFSSNIPDAVIEAARIDGASEFRILRSVVLPMGGAHPGHTGGPGGPRLLERLDQRPVLYQ